MGVGEPLSSLVSLSVDAAVGVADAAVGARGQQGREERGEERSAKGEPGTARRLLPNHAHCSAGRDGCLGRLELAVEASLQTRPLLAMHEMVLG